jgi:hypothetical protein
MELNNKMKTVKQNHSLVKINNQIYSLGGKFGNRNLSNLEVLDLS